MNNQAKGRLAGVLTAVNAFLLAFFLFLTATVAVLYTTLLNPQFMVQVLSRQGFNDQIYAEYTRELEYLAEPAGIDPQVLVEAIPKSEMAQTLRQAVYYGYDEAHPQGRPLDLEAVRTRFAVKLEAYAVAQGFAIEQEVQAGIDNIAGLAVAAYNNHATLPYIQHIGGFAKSAKKIAGPAMLAAALVTLLMAVCLFLGRARPAAKKTAGLVWALSGAGLLGTVWPVALLLFGRLEYLNVQIKSLYLFLQAYIKDVLILFTVTGAAFLVLALAVFLFIYRPLSKKEQA